MSIPLVTVTNLPATHTMLALEHARLFNPDAEIVVLGTRDFEDARGFALHNMYEHYGMATRFARVYKHHSVNAYFAELFCFLRWFVLLEFLRAHGIPRVFHFDSDVFLYADMTQEHARFAGFDLCVSMRTCAHAAFVSTEVLEELCELMYSAYTDQEQYLQRIVLWAKKRQETGQPVAVSDMTFIEQYVRETARPVGETMDVVDGTAFDNNLNCSEGYEMDGPIKKLFFRGATPYGRRLDTGEHVRFGVVHFNGQAKAYTPAFMAHTRSALGLASC